VMTMSHDNGAIDLSRCGIRWAKVVDEKAKRRRNAK